MEKMGTLKKNGDQMGTKNLILVPMGTKVPKWGPTWEQCKEKLIRTNVRIYIRDQYIRIFKYIRHTFTQIQKIKFGPNQDQSKS